MINLILAVIKSIADLLKAWFGWAAKREKEKRDAVDKTTSGIGKGMPFVLVLILLLSGCGYVYTVSTPMAFDANDFQYVEQGQQFDVPNDGYFFERKALEKYTRSKIAEYEIRKRGFFHKEESPEK